MHTIGDLGCLSTALRCECEERQQLAPSNVSFVDAAPLRMSFFRLSWPAFLIQLSCYLEEWIFKALPGFHYHWTVALVELLFFTVAGRGARGKRAAPLTVYAGIGCSLAAGTGLGKLAYRYLNFATGNRSNR